MIKAWLNPRAIAYERLREDDMRNWLAAAILLNVVALGYPQSLSDPGVRTEVIRLGSKEWRERSGAFYAFLKLGLKNEQGSEFPPADAVRAFRRTDPSSEAELARMLTDLLETETSFESSGNAPATEDYSNYYGDLIQAVTTLRDPVSLTVLLKCINTGGMAIGALASMGDAALNSSLRLLPNSDPETHHNLVTLFSTLAEPVNFKLLREKSSRDNLLLALLDAAREDDPYSRVAAVRGLARFSTSPEAVAVIHRLAVSDDFVTTLNGNIRYPVREAAIAALGQAAQ